MVSDSTGETLITVARAVAAQYANVTPVEHVYPLVRSQKQLDRVLAEIEEAPGIVLFTLLEEDLVGRLVQHVRHHLRESIRLEDVARSVGLEPNYFGRRYRELTGRTPMDDVRRIRIDHALGLLRAHPQMPLKEVAARIGMGNCQLLARWLKQSLGMTSREVRAGGGRVR